MEASDATSDELSDEQDVDAETPGEAKRQGIEEGQTVKF